MIQFLEMWKMYEGECYSQSHWHIFFLFFFFVGDIDIVEPTSLSASHILNVTIVTHENRPKKKERKKKTDNISTMCIANSPKAMHSVELFVCWGKMKNVRPLKAPAAPVTNQSQDRQYYPPFASQRAAYWLCFCATFNFVLTFILSKKINS